MGLPKMSMSIEKKREANRNTYMRRSALLQMGSSVRSQESGLLKTIFIQVYFDHLHIYTMSMLIRYVRQDLASKSGINFS